MWEKESKIPKTEKKTFHCGSVFHREEEIRGEAEELEAADYSSAASRQEIVSRTNRIVITSLLSLKPNFFCPGEGMGGR